MSLKFLQSLPQKFSFTIVSTIKIMPSSRIVVVVDCGVVRLGCSVQLLKNSQGNGLKVVSPE